MQVQDIPIYSKNDFEKMRRAGSLAAKILDELKTLIKPGISTLEINDFCHEMIIGNNAIPAPLNYKGFTKGKKRKSTLCKIYNLIIANIE